MAEEPSRNNNRYQTLTGANNTWIGGEVDLSPGGKRDKLWAHKFNETFSKRQDEVSHPAKISLRLILA